MVADRLTRRRYLIAFIVLVTIVLQTAVYAVAEGFRAQSIEAQKREAVQALGVIRARIEGQLSANLIAIRGLRAELVINPSISQQRFYTLTEQLLSDDLQIRHIAIAPDLIVRHVYPPAGNQDVIGLDYRTSPEQWPVVQQAIERREILLAGPLNLVQGGRALVARLPVFMDQTETARLWGLIAEVIDIDELLYAAGFTAQDQQFNYALRGRDGQGINGEHIAGNNVVWQQDYVSVPVNVPGGHWLLAAKPSSATWLADRYGYSLRWTIGTTLVLLLSGVLSLLLVTQTRLRGALSTISYQARFDALTELPNRTYFIQQVEQVLRTAKRHREGFAMLFIDLDHFKEVNDSLGHDAGDDMLQQVAQRILKATRPEDLVARLGGDEFVVVLRHITDPMMAERHAQRLVNALAPTLTIAQNDVHVGASVGIAIYPTDGASVSELLKHADLAMYAAKAAGRQTIYFFDESLRHTAEQHIHLHADMLQSLQQGHFEVYYQPIMDTQGGLLTHCEALLRWHHPRLGMVAPAEFIPVAEKTGAIRALGDFVLQQVLQDWQRLRERGLNLTIAINRSPGEFNHKDIAQVWLDAIHAAGVPPQALMFEITESMLMRHQERQLQNLIALRDAGIQIAIDDFGTGYSSLNYLRTYPVNVIKIDRSFLIEVPHSPQQTALLEALVRIAQTLGLQLIAEGVETAAQRDTLRKFGCHYLQGYLISRPVPFAELVELAGHFTQPPQP